MRTSKSLHILIISLLSQLALALCAHAFVVVDTLDGETFGTSGTGTTFSTTGTVNTGAGANRMLLVGIMGQSNSTGGLPTSVSFNGTALSKADGISVGNAKFFTEIYYLVNPTGSGDIDFDANIDSTNGGKIAAVVVSGVNLNSPFLDTDAKSDDSQLTLDYNLGLNPVDTFVLELGRFNGGNNSFGDPDVNGDGMPSSLTHLWLGDPGSTAAESIGYASLSGQSGTLSRTYAGGANNELLVGVALQAVPEPSAPLLLFLGAMAFLLRRRR